MTEGLKQTRSKEMKGTLLIDEAFLLRRKVLAEQGFRL
jgi:hypothetical protein